MEKIELKIVTPERVLFHEEVESVSMPTIDGEITVLAHHIPIISAIKAGELKIKKEGKSELFAVTRGVAEVDGKTIIILTDAAERAEEIDEERALEAKKKAQEIMAQERVDTEGYTEAVAMLERALSRIRIARKKSRGGHRPSIEQ